MSCVNYIIEKKNEIDYVRAKQIGLKSLNYHEKYFFIFLYLFAQPFLKFGRYALFYSFYLGRTVYYASTVIPKKCVAILKTGKTRSQRLYEKNFQQGKWHQIIFTTTKILLVIRSSQLITRLFLNVMFEK